MINYDDTLFRPMDYIRIWIKKILTRLGLRNKQSCKYCGRNQKIVWTVSDRYWNTIPKKYRNKSLCIECFIELCPFLLRTEDFEIITFDYRR